MRKTAIQTFQGYLRLSVVVPIDAAYMTSYIALNSQLTSIFNRSLDITPIAQNIGLSNRELKSALKCIV